MQMIAEICFTADRLMSVNPEAFWYWYQASTL